VSATPLSVARDRASSTYGAVASTPGNASPLSSSSLTSANVSGGNIAFRNAAQNPSSSCHGAVDVIPERTMRGPQNVLVVQWVAVELGRDVIRTAVAAVTVTPIHGTAVRGRTDRRMTTDRDPSVADGTDGTDDTDDTDDAGVATEAREHEPDRERLLSSLRAVAPGVALLVILGALARVTSQVLPVASELVVAVVLGIAITNLVDVPERFRPGIETHAFWLAAGIVLMGARVSLSTLLDTGPVLVALVLAVAAGTLVLVELLAAFVFDVDGKLGSLLAAGASVCGVSAAVAVAGSIRANQDDVAFAAGTILLFDVVTLVAYPVVGDLLALPERVFGVWAGLTMFSTGPVTAAGFAFGDVAGRWATVTKLTRNLLIGAVVAGYSVRYADPDGDALSVRGLWRTFPKFVLGFFVVVVLTSSAIVPDAVTAQVEAGYRALFLLAFAGLGLGVDAADLRSTGSTPIALVLTALVATSALALVAVQTLLGA
jgi:uncharacterized integral membrane protein (TIGR00698 family)